MSNPEHVKVFLQGVEAWNKWREEHPEVTEPDLSGEDFSKEPIQGTALCDRKLVEQHQEITGTLLQGANLLSANLRGAKLQGANLDEAFLRNARLDGADLSGASLRQATLQDSSLRNAVLVDAQLQMACLIGTRLTKASLRRACLDNADLREAELQRVDLTQTTFRKADLRCAHLTRASLIDTDLEGADLRRCQLEDAKLHRAILRDVIAHRASFQGAVLDRADLRSADLRDASMQRTLLAQTNLEGARAEMAHVDSETRFDLCRLDRATDFSGSGLRNARALPPGDIAYLERNTRESTWKEWYKSYGFGIRVPAKLFWLTSDYGYSSWRIIKVFVAIGVVFAALYLIPWAGSALGLFHIGPFIENLERSTALCQDGSLQSESIPAMLVPVRSVYFSIVTMTTLGFGDMHAHHRSWLGHILLTVQVLFGYVLLAILVTRLAILFQSPGAPTTERAMEERRRVKCEPSGERLAPSGEDSWTSACC